MGGFQASLLDADDEIGFFSLGFDVRRHQLAHGAWLDVRPRWVQGADALFERLRTGVDWHAERRPMHERVGDVPACCLVVMGGSCQRTYEHCVPKTTRTVGPRISVRFRTRGVR